jgi:hypothetical protein
VSLCARFSSVSFHRRWPFIGSWKKRTMADGKKVLASSLDLRRIVIGSLIAGLSYARQID